uniref:Uncharacterized protein n=1 Tax=Anguilla anguilla TaxID=7936 RepID=A0A0E9SJF1_ANGAN
MTGISSDSSEFKKLTGHYYIYLAGALIQSDAG